MGTVAAPYFGTVSKGADYTWRWKCRLPERYGQHCVVLCRGGMNSCAVMFDDGHVVITSRWAIRRAK